MSGEIYINGDGIPLIPKGEWAWVVNEKGADPFYLAFGCPCDGVCGTDVSNLIAVSRDDTGDPHQWHWDGDWDNPTLSPSIQRKSGCNWHGFMTKGILQETR